MKQHRRVSTQPTGVDPDFLEALDDHDPHRASARRQAERKTLQLCRQVHHALTLSLAAAPLGPGLDPVFIDEVTPAPDASRLLVAILLPPGAPPPAVLAALTAMAPRLRADVAAAIHRKRAPELCFLPVGGSDE